MINEKLRFVVLNGRAYIEEVTGSGLFEAGRADPEAHGTRWAHRIIAAVNACAGVDSLALERMSVAALMLANEDKERHHGEEHTACRTRV